MGETKILLVQVLAGKVVSQAVDNIGEGGAEFAEPTHQGALAHAKFSSNDFGSRLASGDQLDQSPLQLANELMALLRPAAKNFFGVIAQDCQQPVVDGSDRRGKLLSAEDYPLVALAKLHRTPE